MMRQFTHWSVLAGLALFAGCTSTRRPEVPAIAPPASTAAVAPELEKAAPVPAPRVAEPETPVVVPPRSGAKRAPAPTAQPAVLLPGEYALKIASEPSGATVVINGKPFGRTPCRVLLAGTARGFLREQVSLKVRFIAADASQSSLTVEEVLTPLDRVPAEMNFTTAGATRVVR